MSNCAKIPILCTIYILPGVILGQNCVWLSDAALDDLFFFEKVFVESGVNMPVNIGLLKLEVPLKCFSQ